MVVPTRLLLSGQVSTGRYEEWNPSREKLGPTVQTDDSWDGNLLREARHAGNISALTSPYQRRRHCPR
jgi:hypothetical protein